MFTLTCWEVRDEDDAATIRAEYDRYGPIVATYLQDANRCSTSNRDAASTGFELWTTWRSLVTNGPVTFAEKLKSHRRVPDILIEGYALIKPDVASSSGQNMHYIILGANWLYRQPGAVVDFDPVRSDGAWVIDSGDRDPDLRRFTQAMSARVPPQVRLSMSALEIKRTTIRPRSDAERRVLLDRWREVFAESLDYQDYDRLFDTRFRRMTGMDWDDIREKMLDALPSEQRHNMESRLGDEVIWFMKEGRSCEGGPNMVAGVMTIYADPNDPSSYGQLIFYGSAGSTCLNEVGRVAREQERALKAAIAEVEREIRRTS